MNKYLFVTIFLIILFLAVLNNPIVPCTKTNPYTTPRDLLQAYRFIIQKQLQSQVLSMLLSNISQYTHCINIDRGDLDEQDSGYSVFIPNSTLKRIRLDIDFLYHASNPVLTGYLLVGKLARANDFILSESKIKSVNCSLQNLHDEQAQFAYLISLNQNEQNILEQYMNNQVMSVKDAITKKILSQQLEVINQCRKNNYACDTVAIDFPKSHNLVLDQENQCF